MTPADPDLTLVTRQERAPIADAAKLMLTPLDLILEVMADCLTPLIRAHIAQEFGAYLGKSQHPALVNRRLLDFVCRTCLPQYSLEEAHREFGRRSVQYYRESSILGRIMMAAVPLMGMERLLRQYPRQLAAVTNYGTRTVYTLAPGEWRLDDEDEIMSPHQLQGNFEMGCSMVHPRDLRVTFTIRTPNSYSFHIHWQP
ncbi:MAG: DUF2378 family protein [Chloroflexota bacterium]|nr:DUF2378 family protein [Chloroflexota bacterium]